MSSHPGWFDAFRDNGGPLLYANTNRTAAVEDVRNILIYITFSTLFVAFLIIFPGIRKERFSTFICVTISLFVGAVILIANFGTSWHIAEASISSPYKAFSKEKIFADVRVKVGLQSVNITLKAKPVHRHNDEINYNERFYWIGPTEMKQEYQNALAKGLPFPILTIAEYLSQDGEGFCWCRRYRLAGYYASILLWVAFSFWILMNVLLCAVPRYGVYIMQLTGITMLCTNAIYALLLPRVPLVIPFDGANLTFNYGWCYWIVMIAGVTSVLVGASVSIIDTLFPNKFSTILEVDYDTPYRYFVGNDAHLFGGNSPHICPHQAASVTSSSATASTCCNSPFNNQCNGVAANKCLTKQKSDASTSTTMSIPVKKMSLNSQAVATCEPIASKTTGTVTTTVDIEHQRLGVINEAFKKDEIEADESDESAESDVSTTIIDGKRAVSLHNFGKFAAQQQLRLKEKDAHFRNRNPGNFTNNFTSNFKLDLY